jgi:hypothetical protein
MAGISQSIPVHAKTDAPSAQAKKEEIDDSDIQFDIASAIDETKPEPYRNSSLAVSTNSRICPHPRVAFLKPITDVELRRNLRPGVTPPVCPLGPTLSRNYIFDEEVEQPNPELFAVGRRYEPSSLSISSLSALPSPKPRVTIKYPASTTKKMPHALSMPQTGFQALILCGPGGSLNTFTTVPKEYPKALISLANRPMVWYVLDWCYRMGVTSKFTDSLSYSKILSLIRPCTACYIFSTHFPFKEVVIIVVCSLTQLSFPAWRSCRVFIPTFPLFMDSQSPF